MNDVVNEDLVSFGIKLVAVDASQNLKKVKVVEQNFRMVKDFLKEITILKRLSDS